MKGLLGAATMMGTLMYGAGHVWAGRANFYLHDHDLCHFPPNEAFTKLLPALPAACLLKSFRTMLPTFKKVRRLHLVVVDLWRPWKYNSVRTRDVTDQLWFIQENTCRVSPFRPDC